MFRTAGGSTAPMSPMVVRLTLRVRWPPWCAAGHDPRGPRRMAATPRRRRPARLAALPADRRTRSLPDVPRVTVVQPQVHPDRDSGGTERPSRHPEEFSDPFGLAGAAQQAGPEL